MAYSSAVPFLINHQHSGVAGDGGTLDLFVTQVGGNTLNRQLRVTATERATGITFNSNNDIPSLAMGSS